MLHLAAPLPGEVGAAEMIDLAVEGALNITRQAAAKGVKRFVFTSTMLTLPDVEHIHEMLADGTRVWSEQGARLRKLLFGDGFLTDESLADWSPATAEGALSGKHDFDAAYIYSAAKVTAEKEIWKFADEHPEMDITTSEWARLTNGIQILTFMLLLRQSSRRLPTDPLRIRKLPRATPARWL